MEAIGLKSGFSPTNSACKETDTSAMTSQITLLPSNANVESMKHDFVGDKIDTVSATGLISSPQEAGVLLDSPRR